MTRFARLAVVVLLAQGCGNGGSNAATARPDSVAAGGGSVGVGGVGGGAIGGATGGAGAGGAAGGSGAQGGGGLGGATSIGPGGAGGLAGAAGTGASSGASSGAGAGGGGSGGSAGASADDLAIVYLAEFVGPDLPLVPLASGDPVHLVVPPQGGHVLFIGARLRNARGDTVRLHARLKNPDDGTTATEETRTVSIVPVAGDPTATLSETDGSSLTQVSNITACPDYAARGVAGLPYLVELTVTELMVPAPRETTSAWLVTPTCPAQGGPDPDAAFCACECAGDYVLGKCPHP